jgi:PRTRC genetic system protein A
MATTTGKNKPKENKVAPKSAPSTELSMEERLAKELCSYHVGTDNLDASTKPFRYVMSGDGVMRVVKNSIGVFVAKADKVPGLQKIEEGLALTIPKVPYYLFQQTIMFFREVMRKKGGAEAMLQFYYDKENGKYIIYCPEQTVSGASVKFKRHEEYDSKYILVMDIHSHNHMNAFFSTIDDADEKETRIFGVIGQLDKDMPVWKFRICVGGVYKYIDIFDIFDKPFQGASFPEEWINKCKEAPRTISTTRRAGQTGTTFVGGKVTGRTDYLGRRNGFYTPPAEHNTRQDIFVPGLRTSLKKGTQLAEEINNLASVYHESAVEGQVTRYEDLSEEYDGYGGYDGYSGIGGYVDTQLDGPDIYTMTAAERVFLVKELLIGFPEDIAQAIYDESAWEDLQQEYLKVVIKEDKNG